MHAYVVTRGIKRDVDMWVEQMSSKFFSYNYEGKNVNVSLAMRPIQLWEIVFPKEHLQEVMNTIWDTDPVPDNFWVDKMCKGARKMLGAKRFPPLIKTGMKRICIHNNLGILPIGFKEDGFRSDGKTEQL